MRIELCVGLLAAMICINIDAGEFESFMKQLSKKSEPSFKEQAAGTTSRSFQRAQPVAGEGTAVFNQEDIQQKVIDMVAQQKEAKARVIEARGAIIQQRQDVDAWIANNQKNKQYASAIKPAKAYRAALKNLSDVQDALGEQENIFLRQKKLEKPPLPANQKAIESLKAQEKALLQQVQVLQQKFEQALGG